jgi:hypothetical protein
LHADVDPQADDVNPDSADGTCFSLSVSWDSFHGQFLNFGFSLQGALVFGSMSIMQQPVIHVILVA